MVSRKEVYVFLILSLLLPHQIWASLENNDRETQYDLDFRWSAWNEFSPCSRSCGVGVKHRYRTCYRFGRHPTPVQSELCRGADEQHHTCNVKNCLEGSLDFRGLQCAFFNGLSHNNRKHSWKPFITGRLSPASQRRLHPCSLVCSALDVVGLIVKFTSQVIDGTSCSLDNTPKVCVKGQCETLGCDHQLGSSATYDRCGVCNGDGSSCDVISGSISQGLYSGYRTLLEIEAGSRNIHIRQTSGPETTVALKSSDGIFFLNDVNRRERLVGTKVIAGTLMYYQQSQNGGPSSVRGEGPITEQLDILGFTLNQYSDINMEYEFNRATVTVDRDVIDSTPQEESYDWRKLLHQSVTSINGLSAPSRSVHDHVTSWSLSETETRLEVKEESENSADKNQLPVSKQTTTPIVTTLDALDKHSPRIKIKTRHSRQRKLKLKKMDVPKYIPESTGSEDVSKRLSTDDIAENQRYRIDGGRTSDHLAARNLGIGINVRSGVRQVDNTEVDNDEFLPTTDRTGYRWRTNIITPCSSTCAFGTQINLFRCEREDGIHVNESFCDASLRPSPTYHKCGKKRCQPRWVTGPWAPCSRTCGGGESVRSVRCWQMLAPGFDSTVHAYLCDLRAEPVSSRRCGEIPCGPQWEVSQWQECSAKCGNGFQTRHVKCSSGSDAYCSTRSRPSMKRSCNLVPCTNQWYTVSWSPCSGQCGRGTRQRHVGCRDSQGRLLAETYCDPNTKPLSTIACGESLYCPPTWVAQPWGTCDLECGTGQVSREVTCGSVVGGKFRLQSDVNCKRSPRPKSTTTCLVEECRAMWFTTSWSECSETCGDNAVKTRDVRCYHGNQTSDRCNDNEKPQNTERCNLRPCPEQEDDSCHGDRIENCHLLVSDLCRQTYYSSQCCATCQRKTIHRDKEP
ncbi:ADAMTS-like protein 2 [Ylistrum balloti]|uniref:ADAMTS-like protein 2 n=1 Tax=Ylistrum balloti TaxID=509963 RepID=UPI002905E490|nr:ADAMTS-like protein 2 [Ylistrum balloti]